MDVFSTFSGSRLSSPIHRAETQESVSSPSSQEQVLSCVVHVIVRMVLAILKSVPKLCNEDLT